MFSVLIGSDLHWAKKAKPRRKEAERVQRAKLKAISYDCLSLSRRNRCALIPCLCWNEMEEDPVSAKQSQIIEERPATRLRWKIFGEEPVGDTGSH
jgi:hypothetical protein